MKYEICHMKYETYPLFIGSGALCDFSTGLWKQVRAGRRQCSTRRAESIVASARFSTVRRASRFGAFIATLFGENPEQQITEDLAQFKHMMESDFKPVDKSVANQEVI